MDCVTKKVCFATKELAEEALINNRVRFNTGPNNIYQCDDCGYYHFTSQGSVHSSLADKETKERIKRETDAGFWEDKFRKR